MNAIEVKNLTKVYKLYEKPVHRLKESLSLRKRRYHREHFALCGLNLTVKKGECLGIMGRNGAGKSTLLKLVTGVLSPTEGEISVNGRISALLELGAGFNEDYTGIENIYLNGTIMGFSREEMDARVEDILAFADIGDYAYQPVRMYSSGMFVRLAFAVAISVEPDILIVDEALAVGDIMFQVKCYRKFRELREKGKTILFVTHALDTILKYCDRAVVMDGGKIVGEGTPAEMVDLYKQVLVGLAPDDDALPDRSGQQRACDVAATARREDAPKETLDYGTKQATIESAGVYAGDGTRTDTVTAGEAFTVRMRVRFCEDMAEPVFAFTIKDVKGYEITGTNTMFEGLSTGAYRKGDVAEVAFTQRLNLTGGGYVISLGCVGFEGDAFKAYHRLYDCLPLQVVNPKQGVGVVHPMSEIGVCRKDGREGS